MTGPARLLYIFASQDDPLRQALESHLTSLAEDKVIEGRHIRLLLAGTDMNHQLATEITHADVVLLLLSADFMASTLC